MANLFKIAELNQEIKNWSESQANAKDMFARFDEVEIRELILSHCRLCDIYINKLKSSIRYYENQ